MISGSLPPMMCGVGDYTNKLIDALKKNPNLKLGVITSKEAIMWKPPSGIDIFPIMNNWNLFEAYRIHRAIRAWKPDVVHVQFPTQGYKNGQLIWLLPIIGWLNGAKIVETWHGWYDIRQALKVLLKALIPGVIIYVHPTFREEFPRLMNWVFWNKKTILIKNASAIPRSKLSEFEKISLRKKCSNESERLFSFFGFVYPHKGVERLFEIANPNRDRLLIVGKVEEETAYGQKILSLSNSEPWRGKVTITGFLPEAEAADLLAISDAVVLPMMIGAGEWNTSVHAGVQQGTFVLTTSVHKNGYVEKDNVYFSKIGDVNEMKQALDKYSGRHLTIDNLSSQSEWDEIAKKHSESYSNLMNKSSSKVMP